MTIRKHERNLEHREHRNSHRRDEYIRPEYNHPRRMEYNDEPVRRYETYRRRFSDRPYRRRYERYDGPRREYDRRERAYGERRTYGRGRIPSVEVMDEQLKRYMAGEKIQISHDRR